MLRTLYVHCPCRRTINADVLKLLYNAEIFYLQQTV